MTKTNEITVLYKCGHGHVQEMGPLAIVCPQCGVGKLERYIYREPRQEGSHKHPSLVWLPIIVLAAWAVICALFGLAVLSGL